MVYFQRYTYLWNKSDLSITVFFIHLLSKFVYKEFGIYSKDVYGKIVQNDLPTYHSTYIIKMNEDSLYPHRILGASAAEKAEQQK